MVTDTYMPARVDTVTIGEIISRRHRLQVYHTTGVFSQSGNHTGMVYVRLSAPSVSRLIKIVFKFRVHHRKTTNVASRIYDSVMRPSAFTHCCPKT